jgi:hypothetical protein
MQPEADPNPAVALAQGGLPQAVGATQPGRVCRIGAAGQGSTASAVQDERTGSKRAVGILDLAIISRVPMFSRLAPAALQMLLGES